MELRFTISEFGFRMWEVGCLMSALELGTWNLESGTWNLEPGTHYLFSSENLYSCKSILYAAGFYFQ